MSDVRCDSPMQQVMERATCLYPAAVVEAQVTLLAEQMQATYKNTNPIVLCVMVGGLVPTAMLMSRFSFPLELDYVHASRYGHATHGGALVWRVRPQCDLKGRTVLIVDDILDGGVTLAGIQHFCQQQDAAVVKTMVLVDKAIQREPGGLHSADHAALTVGPEFLFGMGMDYKGYLRNAPGIYAVAPQDQ